MLDIFRRYPWPGNIRELRNVIRFILSLHSDRIITVEHLPEQLLDFSRQGAAAAACEKHPQADGLQSDVSKETDDDHTDWREPPLGSGATLLQANEAAERRRIVEVLRSNRWNVTEAAVKLNVSRATLHRKIRRYAITSPNNAI